MHETLRCMVNGEHASHVPVTDRGLQFGDGVFETIAVKDNRPVWLEKHLDRLSDGCQRLRISNLPDMQTLATEAKDLCSGEPEAVLKIIVTRGSSTSGYSVPHDTSPNRILILKPAARHASNPASTGIHAGFCEQRLASQTALAGIKHLNRLEQVLARMEFEDKWHEGLMKDSTGHVVEGTMSNLFLIRDRMLITPSLENSGIFGITREIVLELATRNNIPCEVRDVVPEELFEADELFICNSLIGIWPITRLEDHRLAVGNITSHLQQVLREAMC